MSRFETIALAFEPIAKEAAEWYYNRIIRIFDLLADEHGILHHRKEFKDPYDPLYHQRKLLTRYLVDAEESHSVRAPKVLDKDRLRHSADQFGRDQVDSFIAKLTKKIGKLTDVNLSWGSESGSFMIKGKLNEHEVMVKQQVVFKYSSKGNFFLQWPARIYVDGKFIPEKEFTKLVG